MGSGEGVIKEKSLIRGLMETRIYNFDFQSIGLSNFQIPLFSIFF